MKESKVVCDICGEPAWNSDRLVTHSDTTGVTVYNVNPDTRPNRIELLLVSTRSLDGDKFESYDICKKCSDDISGFIIDMRVDNMKRVKDEQTY